MAKRPRSPAQQAASRANGSRSTGPRTAAGKARSRRNALRHGARAAVLEAPPLQLGGPDEQLLAAVRAGLEPADVIGHELADGIATALSRLRRLRELEAELAPAEPGRQQPDGSAKPRTHAAGAGALLDRQRGAGALATLSRQRCLVLGELDRLLRLFEARRPPAAARPAPGGQGTAPCSGRPRRAKLDLRPAPLQAATGASVANDNRQPAAAEIGAGEPPTVS